MKLHEFLITIVNYIKFACFSVAYDDCVGPCFLYIIQLTLLMHFVLF